MKARNLNVEVEAFYDYEDSYRIFEDTMELIEGNTYLYTEFGALSSEYDIAQDVIVKDNKRNNTLIRKWLWKNEGVPPSEKWEGTIDDILFHSYFSGNDLEIAQELKSLLESLGVEYSSNYESTTLRGYSQGDYAVVMVNVKEWKMVIGTDFEMDAYREIFSNIFWDAPIIGEINISFEYTDKFGVNHTYEDIFIIQEWVTNAYDISSLMVDEIIKTIKTETTQELDVTALKEELGKITEIIDK